jgi:PAS domain-containing protein
MPCRDDWSDRIPREETRHGMTISDFEAALCGILTAAQQGILIGRDDALLDLVDWQEAGVTRKKVNAWWRQHQKEDEQRRAREAAEQRKAQLKESALSKLTAEERAALGL